MFESVCRTLKTICIHGKCVRIRNMFRDSAFEEREEEISTRSLETRDVRRKRKFRRKCDFSFEEITSRTYSRIVRDWNWMSNLQFFT